MNIAATAGGSLLVVHFLKALQFVDRFEVDYAIFVSSVRRWFSGLSMNVLQSAPPIIDYNPPHFHLLVLPFAWWPVPVGYVLWTLAGLLPLWYSIRIVRSSCRTLTDRHRRVLTVSVVCAAGVATTLRLGQWSWSLAAVVLSAWPTGFTAALAFAAGAIAFGPSALRGWIDLLRMPPPLLHVKHFINASILGTVIRSGLPLWLGTAAAALVLIVTIGRAAGADTDRAWLLWLIAALLASPLGWIYYEPILIGPLLSLILRGKVPRWAWMPWPAFVFPPISQRFGQWSPSMEFTIGSLYGWGLLGLWIAALGVNPWRYQRSGVVCGESRLDSL